MNSKPLVRIGAVISSRPQCTRPRPGTARPRPIGVGAQSTLGGKTFLPENMHEKLTKCPNFTQFLPEKNSFCPNLGATAPPDPVSYAYAKAKNLGLRAKARAEA